MIITILISIIVFFVGFFIGAECEIKVIKKEMKNGFIKISDKIYRIEEIKKEKLNDNNK